MSQGVRSIITDTDMLGEISRRTDAGKIDPREFERRLNGDLDLACAPQEQQNVALLALWMHGQGRVARSLPSVSRLASRRVGELMNLVFASHPHLFHDAGAWNLPRPKDGVASPGLAAHHLLYLDAELELEELHPDLARLLVQQAGATLSVQPGGERHSLVSPISSRHLYNALPWGCLNPAARDFLARHLSSKGRLLPMTSKAMKPRQTVLRRGQVVHEEDVQPGSIRRGVALLAAQHLREQVPRPPASSSTSTSTTCSAGSCLARPSRCRT